MRAPCTSSHANPVTAFSHSEQRLALARFGSQNTPGSPPSEIQEADSEPNVAFRFRTSAPSCLEKRNRVLDA